jgi:hypothetical protein
MGQLCKGRRSMSHHIMPRLRRHTERPPNPFETGYATFIHVILSTDFDSGRRQRDYVSGTI